MTSTTELHNCSYPLDPCDSLTQTHQLLRFLLCLLQFPGAIQQLTRNRKMTCKHHFVCSFLRIKWCRRHYQIWWNAGSNRKRSLWTSAWFSHQLMKDYQHGKYERFFATGIHLNQPNKMVVSQSLVTMKSVTTVRYTAFHRFNKFFLICQENRLLVCFHRLDVCQCNYLQLS